MTIDPADLLRRLEPAVRRGGPGPRSAPRPDVSGAGFGDLLALVADGSLRSDEALTLADGTLIEPALNEDQFERLASATDQAERAGARRAVMLLDGRAIVIDVTERKIDQELAAVDGPLTGVDAAVTVPAAEVTGALGQSLGGAAGLGPPPMDPRAATFSAVARPPDD
ncbi:MAG: hypothetical protein AB8G96_12985 [Phycisphaerales bacterium]